MGLSDEELEIFDLLVMGKKLTKAQEQEVLLTSKALFQKLQENRQKSSCGGLVQRRTDPR
jgi:hypothetical protein